MTRSIKTPASKKSAAGAKSLTSRAREVTSTCLARATRSVTRKIMAAYDDQLTPHGLSFVQFALLATIAGARNDTLAAIAVEADIDPSTLTRNLQGLERLGFVEIATVEADQRKRSVWLTDMGARRLEAAIPAWEAAQEEMKERLGASLLASLLRAEKGL